MIEYKGSITSAIGLRVDDLSMFTACSYLFKYYSKDTNSITKAFFFRSGRFGYFSTQSLYIHLKHSIDYIVKCNKGTSLNR